ncbi:MAG: 6-oxocyclohex-1-ene-1-carbonyl-CoA hydratase [candidate division KSB1 bacterium]|nr:6-oxocyclohex-1-ene-1-carbonyl-CoA hydratase [candidate division KSB1 bacterium]
MSVFKNHDLVPGYEYREIKFELRPVKDAQGQPVEGLYNAWIILNNPKQLNSYTTQMVKEVILAFRQASNSRNVVAVIFTGEGDRAFCTGGNTKEYAEYYAGQPEEYRQYMRLFNDMVTSILQCDKPVICRVNGMRIAGGQEIGMACDFSVASDMAVFGQAGPKHGSAPDGGSTDFLPLFVGIEWAMISGTLCEHWSAYKAYRLGLISEVVPVLKKDGQFIPNPLAITDRWIDEMGRIVYGEFKTGEEREKARALIQECETDLSLLDRAVEQLATRLMLTMPGVLTKTIESLRKHKLVHWDKNRESNRAWLALNMMTEAKLGFRAFNEGPKGQREVDFAKMRRMLAEGHRWNDAFIESLIPRAKS